MRNTKFISTSIFVLLLLLALAVPASAQEEPQISLSLNRDFGYSSGFGGMGNARMQGTFSLRVKGPADMTRVVFYLDDEILGEDTEEPFRLQFNTSSYPNGVYTMHATGYTASGQELRSNVLQGEFVSAEEGFADVGKILIPLFGLIAGAMLIATLVTTIGTRGKKKAAPGTHRNYGVAGGTICSRCQRPFSRSLLGLNMIVGKLERCPHCGKWAITRAMPLEMLRTAEEAELERERKSSPQPQIDEEERLRKELDDSRFHDA